MIAQLSVSVTYASKKAHSARNVVILNLISRFWHVELSQQEKQRFT